MLGDSRVQERLLKLLSPNGVFSVALAVIAYYAIVVPIYNIWFHPLRKYPGPRLWAASYLPWGFSFRSGTFHNKIQQLHEQYGHIVRITPDELSFDEPEAWDDIYGRGTLKKENHKAPWYLNPKQHMMSGANEEDHKRIRSIASGGFTGAAMLQQEPLVKSHVDTLIKKLRGLARTSDNEIDLFEWFSYCTFDLIGDQTLGKSFGCLEDSKVGPLLSMVFGNVKFLNNLLLCSRIPAFLLFLPLVETWQFWKGTQEFEKILDHLFKERIKQEPEREDWFGIMQKGKGKASMTSEELSKNAKFLTLSGTEAMSTSMAVAIYLIETHPQVKSKVLEELKSVFKSEDEINMRDTVNLPYLTAVVEEMMRFHPPGPNTFWRETPPEGNKIREDWIPGRTILGMPHRAIYRSEQYFKRADEFLPERFLKDTTDTEFVNDRKDGFHPFSYGPRQCLAMNLASAEIRYVIARILWNFDVEIPTRTQNWTVGAQAWLIWEKRPMFVKLVEKDQ